MMQVDLQELRYFLRWPRPEKGSIAKTDPTPMTMHHAIGSKKGRGLSLPSRARHPSQFGNQLIMDNVTLRIGSVALGVRRPCI